MPTRGYRKGISDAKVPVPRSVRTHIAAREHAALLREADLRCLTLSKLLRSLVRAHIAGSRAELPQPRGASSALLREITRIGNNLNQLARQANAGMVAVSADEIREVLARLLAAVERV